MPTSSQRKAKKIFFSFQPIYLHPRSFHRARERKCFLLFVNLFLFIFTSSLHFILFHDGLLSNEKRFPRIFPSGTMLSLSRPKHDGGLSQLRLKLCTTNNSAVYTFKIIFRRTETCLRSIYTFRMSLEVLYTQIKSTDTWTRSFIDFNCKPIVSCPKWK